MSGVIVNLHDAEHTARRRLENRLFRRDTFAFWEQDLIPHNIAESISTHLAAGSVDLLQLARLTMMRISAGIAGLAHLGYLVRRFDNMGQLGWGFMELGRFESPATGRRARGACWCAPNCFWRRAFRGARRAIHACISLRRC